MKNNQFEQKLNEHLKTNKIKKYKFCQRIGITTMTLHRYCKNPERIPLKSKRAIMQYTNNIITFEEVER